MKSKYPFILVHGIALKDFLFFKSFGRIEKILKKNGFDVYTAKIDSFGTIENNALQLKEEIEKIKQIYQVDKVNIIAHSKGGLDAKHLINNLDYSESIASLTTLCTPHKGSRIANWILKWPKFITKIIAFFVNLFYKILGDKKPNAYLVCHQLSYVDNIDEETLKCASNVYCQSYSTILQKGIHDISMAIQRKKYIKLSNEESDGLVTSESAKFGEYKGLCLEDSVSHGQIVDFFPRKKTREKVYQFYIKLCNDLIEHGF